MQAEDQNDRIRAIQEKVVARRFGDALADLDDLPGEQSASPDALYMRAVCHRCRKDFSSALEALATLKAVDPENGRAHQEEAHTLRDMGRSSDALVAYRRATRFNPALVASWKGLSTLLGEAGREAEARQASAQATYLDSLPAHLVAVIDLVSQGRLLKAEDLCRRFLQKTPHHVEAMRLLADIGLRLGVLDDAEFLLSAAHRFEPDNVRVHIDYIQVLRKRQNFSKARAQAEALLAKSPANPQFRSLYAVECMQTGDYDTAVAMFDNILAQLPGEPGTLTSKGHALKTCGRYDDAVAAYRTALASQPMHGEAWYALSNLKVYAFDDDEIARMRDLERNTHLSHADRIHLCFALGKAHEDRQEFETSFRYYCQGNALKKAQSTYDAERMSADLAAQEGVCTPDLFAAHAESGNRAPDPIFVVGLPRAGSTLVEQILSSHSQIDGTLELPNVLSLSQHLRRHSQKNGGPGYPGVLSSLSGEQLADYGSQYLEETRIHRQGAPYFIDKMPNNFRHIGLIRLMLPKAKIFDVRRHPMSCCFSAWKQLFAEGQEFSYDLVNLGRYYRDYVRLMDHWDRVLPGAVLRVRYEDVVAGLEGEVRRILEHCDLPFETACVDFHRTERSVRTPSSEQVRRPIYTSGLAYWRNYEAWLGPLKQALGEDLNW